MWTASSASGFTVSAMAIKPHSSSNIGAAEKTDYGERRITKQQNKISDRNELC